MLKSILGILDAPSWLLLAVIIAVGIALGDAPSVKINVLMATTFGIVGTFLLWRARILAILHRAHPADPVVITLLRTQVIVDLAMSLLGLIFASAAALRIWREALPVFG